MGMQTQTSNGIVANSLSAGALAKDMDFEWFWCLQKVK
jgi:hypothetical protein